MSPYTKDNIIDKIAECEKRLAANSSPPETVWMRVPDFLLEAIERTQKALDEAEVPTEGRTLYKDGKFYHV